MKGIKVRGTTTTGIIYDSALRKCPKCGTRCIVDADLHLEKHQEWNFDQYLDVEVTYMRVLETCPRCNKSVEHMIRRATVHK